MPGILLLVIVVLALIILWLLAQTVLVCFILYRPGTAWKICGGESSYFVGIVPASSFLCWKLGAKPRDRPLHGLPPTQLTSEAAKLSIAVSRLRKCDLPILDGVSIQSYSEFERHWQTPHPRGVLIRNLTKDWPAMRWRKEDVLEQFGSFSATVRLTEVINRFEGSDSPSLPESITLDEYLSSNNSDGVIFENDFNDLGWEMRKHYSIPKIFERAIHLNPIVSIGVAGSNVGFHLHWRSWLAQVVGRKVWLLRDASAPEAYKDRNPCHMLLNGDLPSDVSMCVVEPGEAIFVPPYFHHATCNLDELTLGIGWEGDTDRWPDMLHHISDGNIERIASELKKLPVQRVPPVWTIHAARTGRIDVIRLLVTHQADINSADPSMINMRKGASGSVPIHMAAKNGHEAVLDFLVSHAAELNARDSKGYTALHHSAKRGHSAVVDRILKSYNSNGVPQDVHAFSGPLVLAAERGHIAVVTSLLAAGAGVNVASDVAEREIPLAAAVRGGASSMVKLLLERRARTDDRDANDIQPLQRAVIHGHLQVASLLLSGRANPSAVLDSKEGMTSLHLAAFKGHLALSQLLVANRADVFARSIYGTPLETASQRNHVSVVSYLTTIDSEGKSGVQVTNDILAEL